jgi:hypothetical protein
MKNTMIRTQKFTSINRTSGDMTVSVIRSGKSGHFAVSVNWPAGMDSFPSVKWFEDQASAVAEFPNTCKWIETEYKMKAR